MPGVNADGLFAFDPRMPVEVPDAQSSNSTQHAESPAVRAAIKRLVQTTMIE
jgi:hypothetical protein